MTQFSVKAEGLDKLQRRFRRAPQVVTRYMRRFMDRALPLLEREVKQNFTKPRPGGRYKITNTGQHMSSVTHEVQGTGAKMRGIVGSPLPTMPFVELDTRPHYPPRRPIEFWARRKLGLRGRELQAAVGGIIRAIGRRGTKGGHMFERAFEATKGKIGEMWTNVWGEAVEKEL